MCFLQDRDSQKTTWIAKFVEEVKNDRMVLPALKQIREIFQLFSEVRFFSLLNQSVISLLIRVTNPLNTIDNKTATIKHTTMNAKVESKKKTATHIYLKCS